MDPPLRDAQVRLEPAEQAAKEANACEAGVSIKPGAQAPGSKRNTFSSPRMRATERLRLNDFADKQLSPISWAHDSLHYDPGAYAPGFMLPPASQALISGVPISHVIRPTLLNDLCVFFEPNTVALRNLTRM